MREHVTDIGKVWTANLLALVTVESCQHMVGLVATCLAAFYTATKIHEALTGRTISESYRLRCIRKAEKIDK